MIAAATPASTGNGLLFDWFDLAFLAILAWGLFRGRHNGMSKELIPLLQWLATLLVCGLFDPIVGPFFVVQLKVSKLTGYVLAYVAMMVVIMIAFSMLKHRTGKTLATSNFFKGSEYYLGMIAGAVKCVCVVLVVMALLNAPVYTQGDIAAHQAYMHQVYGGGYGDFSGDYFPTLQNVQAEVLQNSATGSWVKSQKYLARLLITAEMPPPAQPPKPKPIIQIGNQTF